MNAWPRWAPAALSLAACASAPDLRYASADPADTWDSGVRWHASSARSLACSTAYAGIETDFAGYPPGRTLVFQVKLGNHSDSALRVDPMDFRAYAPAPRKSFSAANPESALADVDRRRRAVDADYGLNLAVETGLAVGSLALEIGALFSGDRSHAEAYLIDPDAEQRRSERENRYRNDLARLKDERSYCNGPPREGSRSTWAATAAPPPLSTPSIRARSPTAPTTAFFPLEPEPGGLIFYASFRPLPAFAR